MINDFWTIAKLDVLVVCFWSSASVLILTLGVVQLMSNGKHALLNNIFRYGKTLNEPSQRSDTFWYAIPKRWFIHFYVLGLVVNLCALLLTIIGYWFPHVSSLPRLLLNHVTTQQPITDACSVTLTFALFVIHITQRLYECTCVCVFSEKGRMNISHYAAGILLYSLFPVVIWSQAPPFEASAAICDVSSCMKLSYISGVALFTWASVQQVRCHGHLARMRKDQHGNVKHFRHSLPRGGWFDLVTCPHYLMEMLVYVSLLWVAGLRHTSLWSVFFFVLSNQVISALQSHDWYTRTFTDIRDRDALRKRKAIFPYVL